MDSKYVLGMIGLGTMGRNLLLNMADQGFPVTGYDKDARMLQKLEEEGTAHNLKGFASMKDFIQSLALPRKIMLLVPAGKIVDDVIADVLPLLNKGDIIIDSGNSHFTDTDRRATALFDHGIHFFGMGISGGEEGARFGPSMMPGGDKTAYSVVKPILEAVSAKVNGDPCVTYIGPGASGHFVKMAHNGIEYGIMQLLAEAYYLLKHGMGYDNVQIYHTFKNWNEGKLQCFLIEVTRDIFKVKDAKSGGYLVDVIKDVAKAKGTGKWTSQVSMDLQVPIPTIDEAVSARDLSRYKQLRLSLAAALTQEAAHIENPAIFEDRLEQALYFAMITCYAQGLHLLSEASAAYQYELNLQEISKIWRGGCIIRAELLEDIYEAYMAQPDLAHLYADKGIQNKLKETLPDIRKVIGNAIQSGFALPAFASALTYYDSLRTADSALNLTQAQRDFFGAHTFERTDEPGIFHADWNSDNL